MKEKLKKKGKVWVIHVAFFFSQSIKDPSEPEIKKSKLDSSKSKGKDEKEQRDKDKDRARKDRERKEREEKEAQRQREKIEKEKQEKDEAFPEDNDICLLSDDEASSPQLDAGDFAIEMGITCVVCK